ALEILDRFHGVVSDPSVGAAGVEAEVGQAALDFLDFRKCRWAFAAGEFLHQGPATDHTVAEVHDRQRVVHRGIIRTHSIEIRTEQESGPAGHWHPQFRRRGALRERLAVGARDADFLPRIVSARRRAAPQTLWNAHLVAPVFTAAILAALDQI